MTYTELPWERASHSDARYAAWVAGAAGAADSAKAGAPWHKLPLRCASLLRAALHPDPARRPALADVLAHPWTRDRTSGRYPPPSNGSNAQLHINLKIYVFTQLYING